MSTDVSSILSQPFQVQLDVKVPMGDGVLLSADIYLPRSDGPFPTLLVRTIYDNQDLKYIGWARRFIERGYAVVMQDCRGRHDSDGAWEPYIHEAQDGHDTQEWIGAQPWCDGNIGTFGTSYVGFTQSQTAPLRSRYLKALVPTVSQEDNYGHFYADGPLQLHVAVGFMINGGQGTRTMVRNTADLMNTEELFRRLPLVSALDDIIDLPFRRDAIQHYTFDEFWKSYSLKYKYSEIEAPALLVSGWYDNLMHETFKLFKGWTTKARPQARRLTKLLIGPWHHSNIGTSEPFGSIGFGGDAEMDFVEEQLRWYDRRLKGIDNGMDDEPPVHIFVMGENVWRFEEEWPLARTKHTRYYLHSGGGANSIHGNGVLTTDPPEDEAPDQYRYDPEDPVRTLGGSIMAAERTRRLMTTTAGPWDRRPVERRNDVLVFTTGPLDSDVEVTGPVFLTLYASSSAPDTDFSGTLVDVHPDGKAIIICEGMLRARFRESIEEPTLLEPGKVYELRVDMWETSNVFKAGHRIRLEVSSSNFPRFDRNLNTGNHPGTDAEMRVADQTIYHDAQRPSHVTLPIIPR